MLDQSFSAASFRRILDQENRKGVYLEGRYFPNTVAVTEQIKQCNADIKEKKKSSSVPQDEIDTLKEKLDNLKQTKEDLLMKELQNLSDRVVDRSFEIKLKRTDIPNSKPIYTPQDTPEHYFSMKQLQRNVANLFGVKQANRSSIVAQVKALLNDRFPKYVVRMDIKDFYESIPHQSLLERINGDNLLTPFSRKLLRQILNEYKAKSGSVTGIPRGIGVSAYLAELYMRDVDKDIKALPGVTYYARYVDDIVIIFTPTATLYNVDLIDELKSIVGKKYKLALNSDKTHVFDLRNGDSSHEFDYLGYKIHFGNGEIKTKLTKRKTAKYKKRISSAFDEYVRLSRFDEKKARKLLVKRVRYLTGNTSLLNNKNNILVGIYYSNSELTDNTDLIGLDRYLDNEINKKVSLQQVKQRLRKYSFNEGFETKKFSPFTAQDLKSIVKVWK